MLAAQPARKQQGVARVKLYRIGDKVVSEDKLHDAIGAILDDRAAGATQEDAAHAHGVQRSFVSFLETLGEVRRGNRIALVAFPVANADEVKALAAHRALDFVLVLSQEERESIESGEVTEVFNTLLETIATLRDFDTLVLLASDWRISTMEKILGTEVVGIPLGTSPLREAVHVDIASLDAVLESVLTARPGHGLTSRGTSALKDAESLTGRWEPSKKS
jgi:hypothetical protein